MGTPAILSEAAIVNLALARGGMTQVITSFTDGSVAAGVASQVYPALRDSMLAEFPYPWCEGYLQLVEVAGPETTLARANSQWMRAYQYPSDCLKMRRIVKTPPPITVTSYPQTTGTTGVLYDHNEYWRRACADAYPVSYGLGNAATGRLIMCDVVGQYGLTAIYTQAVSDPTQFSPDFTDALAWRLAADLNLAISYSEEKWERCHKMADKTAMVARATAMNQLQSDIPYYRKQAETVRARFGG